MVNVNNAQLERAATKQVDDYRNTPDMFIADFIAPRVEAANITGKIPRFSSTNQKDINDEVGPHSPTPLVEYDLSSTDFECTDHRRRLHLPDSIMIPLRDAGKTGAMLREAGSRARIVAEAMQIRRERLWAAKLVDTSNSVTAQSTPSTKWNTTGGDPAATIATAKGTIDDAINRIPEYGLMTRDVAFFLMRHVASLRAGASGVGMAPMSEVALYLGLKELKIINAGYDSAAVGAGRSGSKVITGNKFWVFHKPMDMSAYAPSWACTPTLSGVPTVSIFREDSKVKGEAVEVYDWRDDVIVDKTACIYIPTPLTT